MLSPSDLHSRLPSESVSANVVGNLEHIQYPGIFGTGFFAKRDRQVFYFTALHCMRSDRGSDQPAMSTLMIPYRLTGLTSSPDDFVQFDTAFTISGTDPDDIVDLVACPVTPKRSKDFEHLLSRSVKLPASGEWLDDYLSSELGQTAISSGSYSAYVVGHLRSSSGNEVTYAEEGAVSIVSTEAVVLEGRVTFSDLAGHLSLHPAPSPHDFSGLSGSPVFAPVRTRNGQRFALLGMVVCGSTRSLNFLPIGRLLEAITGDA
jgi:hypothetical protein